ncbi:DUF2490 domain-containing protein [Alloacidobacterium dinghuense]|uniref:DUF2490 domain-containing protein n=1 Tax=Alloacidobacterium dinghuense TaxID=2763107 RepID=A0A7G8BL32_9BACT|nr:DUF2490 domain-containing protein [Alloacidobacterium dinghuense]QNI33252.1 DUF2490 domain-containing protein [Alloacidobacterium dinghuense]
MRLRVHLNGRWARAPQSDDDVSSFHRTANHRTVLILLLLCCCIVFPVRAQQQQPEDPEDEHQIGLWLDQGISFDLSKTKSLESEFHERFDDGASNLFEYFGQAGLAFRPRPWLMLLPSYRYARYPSNPTSSYENRLLLNLTLLRTTGRWRPNFRMLTEGRFPENRIASARLRFRPGIDYVLPLRVTRPPVLVVNDEIFVVPGTNSFSSGSAFTQNRFQTGIRLPITGYLSTRLYYMLQSVNLPVGWKNASIFGVSVAWKARNKNK